MVSELAQHLARGDRSCAARRRLSQEPSGELLDLGQAGVSSDGLSAGQAQLDAVVLRWVVRGREHRTGCVEGARCEVEKVSRRHPEVDHVDPGSVRALSERLGQRDPRGTHVARHQHGRGAAERRHRRTDRSTEILVDLIWIGAADVVRLEDLGGVGHRATA